MSSDQAQSAVAISAAVVFGLYAYRKLTEGASARGVPAVGHFAIGFGFTYVSLSVLATVAPEVGGMFAVLVAVGDVMVNGLALTQDITTGLADTAAGTTSSSH